MTWSSGQKNLDMFFLGLLQRVFRQIEFVELDSGIADADSLRFEERIGHGAADHEPVHLLEKVVDDGDLVGDFGSAEDRDEGPFRVFHGFGEEEDFLAPEEARPRWAEGPRTPAVEACARCTAPKASWTNTSARDASCLAKAGSLASSSAWKRRFSRSRIPPGFKLRRQLSERPGRCSPAP